MNATIDRIVTGIKTKWAKETSTRKCPWSTIQIEINFRNSFFQFAAICGHSFHIMKWSFAIFTPKSAARCATTIWNNSTTKTTTTTASAAATAMNANRQTNELNWTFNVWYIFCVYCSCFAPNSTSDEKLDIILYGNGSFDTILFSAEWEFISVMN